MPSALAEPLRPAVQPGSKRQRPAVRYALSVAALTIPMGITAALKSHPNLNPIISASFVIVISGVAWWAGAWAGILLSCLAIPALTLAATGFRMWIPPHIDFIGLAIFWFIAFLVGSVATNRKRIEQMLRDANTELEAKVQERTADLRNANSVIQNRLAELELLYSQLPVGLCFLDGDLHCLRINQKLAAINGAPVASHLGRSLRAVIPAGVADVVEPLYRKVIASGEPVVDFELSGSQSGDADVERTWLIDCCPAMAADGSTLGLQVIVQDITERKRSEESLLRAHAELARREREFRTVVNAIPQICWVSNRDGSVAWYNDRWFEYTGMKQADAEAWKTYIPDEVLPTVLQRWKDALRDRKGFEVEILIRGASGACRWFLTRTVPMHDDAGEICQWFGTSTDVDDLKRSREALIAREKELRQANSDLQQFAYSASHDLQEPIRTVAVYSQMLERRYGSQFEGDAKKFLGFVGASAKRMEKLVLDLLRYVETAHVNEGISEITESSDALRDAISNVAATVEETQAQIYNDPLPALRIRRIHLQQVFQNLLSNSLKYRSNEQPKIHIAAKKHDGDWIFSVRDNGIGIDPAYKERVFGIFKRLHTADKYSGTGIGLAICQRVVQRYGGRIWLDSELGRGTTFFFAIPEQNCSPSTSSDRCD